MKPLTHLFAAALGIMPLAAEALGLDFPGSAQIAAEDVEGMGSYALPVGAWRDGAIETLQTEGEVRQQAWHLPGEAQTTLQLLAPLRDQLNAEGFDILFECEARQCGGFEFRYGTEVLPEPEMHVDLGDFRFLSARRAVDEDASEFVSLLVSRSSTRGFVQLVRVGAPLAAETALVASSKSPETAEPRVEALRLATPVATTAPNRVAVPNPGASAPDGLIEELVSTGRAVLGDLSFKTGSSQLGEDSFVSLAMLAAFLEANPEKDIVLVGHTDAEGALPANVVLSKKRAASVLRRLSDTHGIKASRMKAEGVGYLMPLASNATEEGRRLNRRVEVVISTTE